MNDDKILELFFSRDEQAIRESMEAYGAYCHAVAAGILSDPSDIEEVVADTYLAAWDTIPPQRPTHLRLYLGRITRNCAIDRWRKNNADRRGGGKVDITLEELSQCVSPSGSPEQAVDAKQLAGAINRFLQRQTKQQRQVFLRRYFYLDDIASIARRYRMKEVNVRMMLSRTRGKLKKYLMQEGFL